MNRLGSILLYTVVRLAFFLVPLGLLLLLPDDVISPWIAAVLAALIGVSLSILLLDKLRNPLTEAIARSRTTSSSSEAPADDDDNDYENAVLDLEEEGRASAPSPFDGEAPDPEGQHKP